MRVYYLTFYKDKFIGFNFEEPITFFFYSQKQFDLIEVWLGCKEAIKMILSMFFLKNSPLIACEYSSLKPPTLLGSNQSHKIMMFLLM